MLKSPLCNSPCLSFPVRFPHAQSSWDSVRAGGLGDLAGMVACVCWSRKLLVRARVHTCIILSHNPSLSCCNPCKTLPHSVPQFPSVQETEGSTLHPK